MIVREMDGVVLVIDSVFYPVKSNSKVTLTVEVGDFQAGGTAYSWAGTTVIGTPNFEDHAVNKAGVKIVGTMLHAMTRVMDIRPETNQTSVTYTLKGGVQDLVFPYGVQVPEDGTAKYQVTFIFTAQAP